VPELHSPSRRILRQAQGKISSKFYGKEINDSESEPKAEILESDRSAMPQMRPAAWFYARLQPLPYLLP